MERKKRSREQNPYTYKTKCNFFLELLAIKDGNSVVLLEQREEELTNT